jgi:signal transduction histidine kinase
MQNTVHISRSTRLKNQKLFIVYLFMNRKYIEHLSLQPGETRGRSYSEFHNKGETKEFQNRITSVLETGKASSYVHESKRDDRYYHRTLSPVSTPEGNIIAITVVSREIIEIKQAEDELKKTYENLSHEHDQRKILSSRLINLSEKEHQSIAMELHDNIGQILTSLKLDIEILQENLKHKDKELEIHVKAAKEKASRLMGEIKNISRGLRPSIIDSLGLESSLRELINRIQQVSNINVRFFSRDRPKHFNPEKEFAFYRIAQEALNNTLKHAGDQKAPDDSCGDEWNA